MAESKGLDIADALKTNIFNVIAGLDEEQVYTGQNIRQNPSVVDVQIQYLYTQSIRRDTGLVRHFFKVHLHSLGADALEEDTLSRELQDLATLIKDRYDKKISNLPSALGPLNLTRSRWIQNGGIDIFPVRSNYDGAAQKQLRVIAMQVEIDELTEGASGFQYECVAYNGIVFGGYNIPLQMLMSWDADFGGQFQPSIAIMLREETDDPEALAVRMQDILKALRIEARSFGLSAGLSRKSVVAIQTTVFVDDIIELTRQSGDTFDAALDSGQPVHVETNSGAIVGSYQVESVTSAEKIKLRVPAWQQAHFSSVVGAKTLRFGEVVLQASEVEKIGGINAQPVAKQSADSDDETTGRRIDWAANFTTPALEHRPEQDGLKNASIARTQSPEGLDIVAFVGQFSAGNLANSPQIAQEMAAAQLDTWIATQRDKLNPGLTIQWENSGGIQDEWDDQESILSFARTYRQMNFPDSETQFNDPVIKNASVTMRRIRQNIHGLSNSTQPSTLVIDYSCGINTRDPDKIDVEDIPEKWATIKQFLVGRAQAIFGGVVSIESAIDPVIDPVTSQITATLNCILTNSATTIASYSRTISMSEDERLSFDEKLDGQDFSAFGKSPGRWMTGVVTVEITQFGNVSPVRQNSSNSLATLPSLGIFGAGEALPISFGNGTNRISSNDAAPYPEPPNPGTIFGGNYQGRWKRKARGVQYVEDFIGLDPDGVGSKLKRTRTVYTTPYTWLAENQTQRERPVSGGTGNSAGGQNEAPPQEIKKPGRTFTQSSIGS